MWIGTRVWSGPSVLVLFTTSRLKVAHLHQFAWDHEVLSQLTSLVSILLTRSHKGALKHMHDCKLSPLHLSAVWVGSVCIWPDLSTQSWPYPKTRYYMTSDQNVYLQDGIQWPSYQLPDFPKIVIRTTKLNLFHDHIIMRTSQSKTS